MVSLRNVYAPVSQLDVAGLPALAESYSRQFSALPPLVTILASLHRAKPFVEALQIPASTGRRSAYLNMLVWLLSKGLVAEVRVYYRLVANTEIKWRATQPERQTPQSNSRPASSCEDAPRGETDEPHSATTNVAESPSNSSLNLGALDSPARPMSFTHRQPSIPSDASEAPMETCRSPVPIPGHEGPRSAPSRTMSGVTSSASFRSQDPPPASEYSLTESSVIAEPGEPNSLEVKWLKLMTEGKSAEIQRRFERCALYYNNWE